MNENKYQAYMQKEYRNPVIPHVKFDMRGLINLAKEKGVEIAQLAEEDKKRFVTPLAK